MSGAMECTARRMRISRWKGLWQAGAATLLVGFGNSMAWGQAASESGRQVPASPPPLPAPSTPTSRPPAATSVEERLQRMEDAYRRMEQANRRIQSQYDALSKRYDELNRRVNPGSSSEARGGGSVIRPASRSGAVEFQEPPASEARSGLGAEGMGGRTAPDESFRMGAEGVERRSVAGGAVGLPVTGAAGGGAATGGVLQGAQAGISRRGAGGFGAQGTEGRVFYPETSARGEEKVQRRLAKVEFAEGLELSSDGRRVQAHFP